MKQECIFQNKLSKDAHGEILVRLIKSNLLKLWAELKVLGRTTIQQHEINAQKVFYKQVWSVSDIIFYTLGRKCSERSSRLKKKRENSKGYLRENT